MNDIFESIKGLAKEGLPAWATALWTVLICPLFLWWWDTRKVPQIAGLQVVPSDRRAKPIKVSGVDCSAIQFEFLNNTKRVLYLTDMAIVKHTRRFKPRREAQQDITDHSFELKFMEQSSKTYSLRQIVVQTNDSAKTVLPVELDDFDEFLSHHRSWWRTFFRCPRYFVIEFVAMEGTRRHRVSFVY